MNISKDILALKEDVTAWRRLFHQHPQTAFEEVYAHDFIVEKLKEWRIAYTDGWATTGIVATIQGNETSAGKTIGLRADMDALDMTEENDLPWCSSFNGKMHGCGHDGHMAMLLGTAKYLNEHRDFNGTVHLIFQPGEEGGNGAEVMVKEGLFDQYPCDAIFGLHNWHTPFGTMATRPGSIMAAAQSFEIDIEGEGTHAAFPHCSIDPVLVASHIVLALQSIVSRNIDPLEPAVVTVANINAGTGAHNVISEKATLNGTFRTLSNDRIPFLNEKIELIAQKTAQSFGAKATYKAHPFLLATVNTEKETDLAAKAASAILGEENVTTDITPVMGAEDFSFMLKEVPGAYVTLGQGIEGDTKNPHSRGCHHPKYDFNDDLIPIGIAYFVEVVKQALTTKESL